MFKKVFDSKIISLILSALFLSNTLLYASPFPSKKQNLRLQIGAGDDTYDRIGRVEKALSSNQSVKPQITPKNIQTALERLKLLHIEDISKRFTVREVAEELGVEPELIYRAHRRGNINLYTYASLQYESQTVLKELKTLAEAIEKLAIPLKYGPKYRAVKVHIGPLGEISLKPLAPYPVTHTEYINLPLVAAAEALLLRGVSEFEVSFEDGKDYLKEVKKVFSSQSVGQINYRIVFEKLASLYSRTKSSPFSALLDVLEVWSQQILDSSTRIELFDVLKFSGLEPSSVEMGRLSDLYRNLPEARRLLLPLIAKAAVSKGANGIKQMFELVLDPAHTPDISSLEFLMSYALDNLSLITSDNMKLLLQKWYSLEMAKQPNTEKLTNLIQESRSKISMSDKPMLMALRITDYLCNYANTHGLDLDIKGDNPRDSMKRLSMGLLLIANLQDKDMLEKMFPVLSTLIVSNANSGFSVEGDVSAVSQKMLLCSIAQRTVLDLSQVIIGTGDTKAIKTFAYMVTRQPFRFSRDENGLVREDFDDHLKFRLQFLTTIPESIRRQLLIDLRTKLLLGGAPVKEASFVQIELSRLLDATTSKTWVQCLQLFNAIPLSTKVGPQTMIDIIPKRLDVVGPKGAQTGIPGLLRAIRILAHSSTSPEQLDMLKEVARFLALGEKKGMLRFFEPSLLATVDDKELEPLRTFIHNLMEESGIPTDSPEKILELDDAFLGRFLKRDVLKRDVLAFWNQSEDIIAHTTEDRVLLLIRLFQAFQERYGLAGLAEERLAGYKFPGQIELVRPDLHIRQAGSKDSPFPTKELLETYGKYELSHFPAGAKLNSLKEQLMRDLHELRAERPLDVLRSLHQFRNALRSEILAPESYVIETFTYARPHAGQVKGDPRFSTIGYYKEPKFEWYQVYRDIELLEDQLLGGAMELLLQESDPAQRFKVGCELLNSIIKAIDNRGLGNRSLRDYGYLLAEYPVTLSQSLNLLRSIHKIHKNVVSRLLAEHRIATDSTLGILIFPEQLSPKYSAVAARGVTPDAGKTLVREQVLSDIVKHEMLLRRFGELTEHLIRTANSLELAGKEAHRKTEQLFADRAEEMKSLISTEITMLSSYDAQRLSPEQEAVVRGLFGTKAAGLLFLRALGIPVPDGFVIPVTELRSAKDNEEDFHRKVIMFIQKLERLTGKKFGDFKDPLLVSVRSGAVISMPGIMETFGNIGLNETITDTWTDYLLETGQDPWFIYDSLRRLYEGFGTIVFNIQRKTFNDIIERIKKTQGVSEKKDLPWQIMKQIAREYKLAIEKEGYLFPDDPYEQLFTAIGMVEVSWWSEQAQLYRREEGISDEWGTPCIVQEFVFGNISRESGSGVIFTSDVTTGEQGITGNIEFQAQGEDVVSGMTSPLDITALEERRPALYSQLESYADVIEAAAGYPQENEFTIQRDELLFLQTRDAPEFGTQDFPKFAERGQEPIGQGDGVYGDAFRGIVVESVPTSDSDLKALLRTIKEEDVEGIIIIREFTGPEEAATILALKDELPRALLTRRGGRTSHMGVIAMNNYIPTVVGCSNLRYESDRWFLSDLEIIPGKTVLSLSGKTGRIYEGRIPLEGEKLASNTALDKSDKTEKISTAELIERRADKDKLNKKLFLFYTGELPDHRGRFISDIWKFNHEQLEDVHDYIQLLFPDINLGMFFGFHVMGVDGEKIVIPQLVNGDVDLLHEQNEISTRFKANMLKSLDLMLDFYGFQYRLKEDEVVIEKSPEFEKRQSNWITPGNHNFLRITRILKSLRWSGLEKYAMAFFNALSEVYNNEEYKTILDASSSFEYWQEAVKVIRSEEKLTVAEFKSDRSFKLASNTTLDKVEKEERISMPKIASNTRADLNTMYNTDNERMQHVFVFLASEAELGSKEFLGKLRKDCNLVSNGNRIIIIAENETVKERLEKEGFTDNINLDIVIFGKDLHLKDYRNIYQINAKIGVAANTVRNSVVIQGSGFFEDTIDVLSHRLDMINEVDAKLARQILNQV